MNFEPSDEQRMLAEAAERYLRDHGDGDHDHWRAFADFGWLALPLPEDAGGLGGSDLDVGVICQALGRGLLRLPYVDSVVLGGGLIAASRDAALRGDRLRRIAAGEAVVALAHREAAMRSDYDLAVTATAARIDAQWKLDGRKPGVVHGARADHWLVSARIGDQGAALFVVDRDAAAIEQDYALIDGSRAADLRLEATPARLLLEPADLPEALEKALDRAVVAASAAAVGHMDAVLEQTADYLQQRRQYGRALAQFQVLQHHLADMLIDCEQARSSLLAAHAALQAGDPDRRRGVVSGTKALIGKAALSVAALGIQLHGGIGVTEEYAVGRRYKALLAYAQRFGDREFHLLRRAATAAPLS
ncbi:acyl-CoA dehydrogenase family protein [Solimonas soli]|uniref:acyl-CoA dehydrogenase family protein n=1 Tax=Solimonas soli TaxID=413479 RepID=UPI00047F55EB|nr:acyl-CoA dehydrogenase [Solimonas soli]